MPSAGYSHFYCPAHRCHGSLGTLCQCPRRAILISTGQQSWLRSSLGRVCQCPRRAILISTSLQLLWDALSQNECQCPRRAILISTVPSGNPHKYWLFSPIFASICLNILKSSVFPLFLVLFTICSYLAPFTHLLTL